MKRRAGGKRERRAFAGVESLPGVSFVRGGDFRGVWFPGPAASEGPREVHSLVVAALFGGGHWHCLGDVSVLALTASRTAHAFRRGLATNLHALGIPDKEIQAILRHSNISVTQSCYIKALTESQVSAMDLVGEEFENSKSDEKSSTTVRGPIN